ncbi:PIN domain-containing protein [Nevskia sp.]|uniref:type II toxin-antitoxin system VapC family toxin n=1 Tax=Nevskia sp. TaxID=1929292 RepID=UPI0025D1D973|nr:PIN domain-containing protein [Nevskia sp.]
MYLVDSSVWIDFGRPHPRPPSQMLRRLIEREVAVHLTGTIVQEILQGARDDVHLARMTRWLAPHRLLVPKDAFRTAAAAAALYARCRWAGVTPRSANDCLIAQFALDYELTLLHDDADFERIAIVEPRLKLA